MMNRKFILVGLLMAVFAFPLVLNVGTVDAESYGCKGNNEAVRKCLKDVIRGLEREKDELGEKVLRR